MSIRVRDLVVCFFFKQKTAYEMRISDWSSDVCSSDLMRLPAPGDDARGRAIDQRGRQRPGDFAPDLAVQPGIEARPAMARGQREGPARQQVARATAPADRKSVV